MADIKWIKITTDIFDDEKILLIESLPDADSIIVIWFKLLCLAGKQNNSGVFMLNNIAYTDKMLATIFRRKETTVQLALQTFEQFGMIEIIDGVVTIPNWEKHQSLDAYEQKKERDRIYQAERRNKQKLIATKSSDCHTTKSSDVEKNRLADKEEDIEEDKKENKKEEKHIYGEYRHVRLSDSEFARLIKQFGEAKVNDYIRRLDEYIQQKGERYLDHNLTIRNWMRKEEERKPKSGMMGPAIKGTGPLGIGEADIYD